MIDNQILPNFGYHQDIHQLNINIDFVCFPTQVSGTAVERKILQI